MLEKEDESSENIDTLLAELVSDHRQATISTEEKVALDYAVKLTVRPYSMTIQDVETLKQNGFDERAVHDICTVTSYFGFVNRIADGLGVELEERF